MPCFTTDSLRTLETEITKTFMTFSVSLKNARCY